MENPKYNSLTPEEQRVILQKGTEYRGTGKYNKFYEDGIYICRQCNAPLYFSHDKFNSNCGWPSFDDEIPGAVKRNLDADGRRVEIVCDNCEGHLGHVFEGERFTAKNARHCVNSISMSFVPQSETNLERALFASGCFWGKQFNYDRLEGVVATRVGYTGGSRPNPTSMEVSSGKTGHAETVEVVFDKTKTDFETLLKYFFETHDPTVAERQGGENGGKYRSAIFYTNEEQKTIAEKIIAELKSKDLNVVTELGEAFTFYGAEKKHQKYYDKLEKEPERPYYEKRF